VKIWRYQWQQDEEEKGARGTMPYLPALSRREPHLDRRESGMVTAHRVKVLNFCTQLTSGQQSHQEMQQ
jgi:hypothetical protein